MNKYVSFVSDEYLLSCINILHNSYTRAKLNITKESFYSNKIDIFKLAFDTHFNDKSEKEIIEGEILRQIDKTINNSIGTFHENVLGGISGYEAGKQSGYDIRAIDNSLFADIKNKHNTMNSSSSEALFQKLSRYADDYKKARCYWVQVLAKGSFHELWSGEINGKEYSHSRVYKISGDQFYFLLTGRENALFELYTALPEAINDFLRARKQLVGSESHNSIFTEINSSTSESGRSLLNQISIENFPYYLGFDKL